MLSFRMILFAGVAGLCLWGLFDLLDNLKQPELLRSAKVVVVKGCDTMESDEAKKLCPQLHCEKAILDAKQVALAARFTVTVDKTDSSTGSHLIGGTVAEQGKQRAFTCVLQKNKVVTSQVDER